MCSQGSPSFAKKPSKTGPWEGLGMRLEAVREEKWGLGSWLIHTHNHILGCAAVQMAAAQGTPGGHGGTFTQAISQLRAHITVFHPPPSTLHTHTHTHTQGSQTSILHVTKLTVGVYEFELTVTDSAGHSDVSTVTVDVKPGTVCTIVVRLHAML